MFILDALRSHSRGGFRAAQVAQAASIPGLERRTALGKQQRTSRTPPPRALHSPLAPALKNGSRSSATSSSPWARRCARMHYALIHRSGSPPPHLDALVVVGDVWPSPERPGVDGPPQGKGRRGPLPSPACHLRRQHLPKPPRPTPTRQQGPYNARSPTPSGRWRQGRGRILLLTPKSAPPFFPPQARRSIDSVAPTFT